MRRTALVAVLALTTALAVGCGDDGGSETDDNDQDTPVVALTADQIAEAVLQPDNMGEGWTSEPATEDSGAPGPGCIGEADTLTDGLEKQDRGGTEFNTGEALRVESRVSTYADETALAAVFDLVQTVLLACSTVTGPDPDGNMWDLTLTATDEATYDDVDDQYSVSGSGTITTPGGDTIDVHLEQTAVRLGPNVGSIGTFDIQSRTTEHATWAEIAVERLVDVAEGDEPEETTAPAPAGDAA